MQTAMNRNFRCMQIAMNRNFNFFTLLRTPTIPQYLSVTQCFFTGMFMHAVMHDFAIYPLHPHSIAGKMNEMQASLQVLQEAAYITMNANPAYIATSKERQTILISMYIIDIH